MLDLGCGAGEPIAGWLIEKGYTVIGVDFALSMLELARNRWPNGDWRHCDMRALDFPERFDGIVAWDSFFHLTPDEQISCLPLISRHLRPGGTLMLTVGPHAGETTGTVGGSRVYHASLSLATYTELLAEGGLELRTFSADDPACGHHTGALENVNGVPSSAGSTELANSASTELVNPEASQKRSCPDSPCGPGQSSFLSSWGRELVGPVSQ